MFDLCTFCIMVYRVNKSILFPENSRAILFLFNVAKLKGRFNRCEMFIERVDSWFKEKYI